MANYKKVYDLEWSDLFMNKCNEVTRKQAKARKYAKRQANKAARRASKKITEIEVPVVKYVTKCEAYWNGKLEETKTIESFNPDEVEYEAECFEFHYGGYDIKITDLIIKI